LGENSDVFLGKFGKKTQTPVYFGLWWWTISEHPSDIDVPMGAPRSPAALEYLGTCHEDAYSLALLVKRDEYEIL